MRIKMGREAKDTIGVNVGVKMVEGKEVDDVREVMPLRTFALSDLSADQKDELLLQALKIQDGNLVRARAKKLIHAIQINSRVLADLEAAGATKEMMAIMRANPAYSTEIPPQMEFTIKDYFDVSETPAPEEKKDEGKGRKGRK